MAKEKIQVRIPLEGPIVVKAIGYKGPACALDVKKVLDSLGGEAKVEKTPDYHKREVEPERERMRA